MTYWLIMKSDEGERRPFPLDKPRTVIGRELQCDVRIPIAIVDRKHCEIVLDGGKLRLTDLGSERGTYHNGNRVESTELANDDELKIGPVTFQVCSRPDG